MIIIFLFIIFVRCYFVYGFASLLFILIKISPFSPLPIAGVLIYEMLVGYPPFYADNPFGIYEKILNGKYEWPRLVDPVAKDIVKKLLVPDRVKRLGNMKNGAEDVRRHRWFKHLDWDDVYNRRVTVILQFDRFNSCANTRFVLLNAATNHTGGEIRRRHK